MINNSTNINKTNNHLSPQLIEHKKDQNIWCWKSKSRLGTGTIMSVLKVLCPSLLVCFGTVVCIKLYSFIFVSETIDSFESKLGRIVPLWNFWPTWTIEYPFSATCECAGQLCGFSQGNTHGKMKTNYFPEGAVLMQLYINGYWMGPLYQCLKSLCFCIDRKVQVGRHLIGKSKMVATADHVWTWWNSDCT